MSDRAFVGLLVVGVITASPFIAFAELWALAVVDFHDVLLVAVFVAVLTHLHLARRDRRADHRAARQAARAAWSAPRPRASWEATEDLADRVWPAAA